MEYFVFFVGNLRNESEVYDFILGQNLFNNYQHFNLEAFLSQNGKKKRERERDGKTN